MPQYISSHEMDRRKPHKPQRELREEWRSQENRLPPQGLFPKTTFPSNRYRDEKKQRQRSWRREQFHDLDRPDETL